MLNRIRDTLLKNKYKLAIFVLLAAASVGCVLLIGARVAYSDSLRHLNLVWNLFLAWIPFVLAYIGYALSWKRTLLYVIVPAFAFLWLIFLPNAPYLLTDLMHLNQPVTNVPLWYDVLLMIWFSWTGMLLGVISLYLMHEIVIRAFGKVMGWIFVFAVSGLSSLGIYLGRFLRWNSWDILQEPQDVLQDSLALVLDPSRSTIGFTILFTAFFLFVYLTLYAFGHVLQEQKEVNMPAKAPQP
jgi:uncharacterized membrane protein